MTATLTVAEASYPQLRRSALATGAVFTLSGMTMATWVSRLPEVKERLGADTGSLGLALLFLSIGSILSTPVTGRLVTRFGSRPVVAVQALVANSALVGMGAAPSVELLGVVLFVHGFGYASWDVAMNIHGHGVEAAAGKAWMPRYHSAWSVGGFTAAGLGALAAAIHLPVVAHFAIMGGLIVGLVVVALRHFLVDREEQVEHDGPKPAKIKIVNLHFVILGVVMACATLIEGAASDWLGIYFHDERDLSPAASAAAYTTFAVAMAVSRGLGTWLIEALGRHRAVRLSGVLACVGVSVLLLAPATGVAYAGAALWGLGVAAIFPAVISAAGDTPGRSAQAIALVTPIGYTGFLFGPPLIGLLARHIGLENALWLVGALAAVSAVLAGATKERARISLEREGNEPHDA